MPVPTHPSLVYARIADRDLRLDLHLPPKMQPPAPLILWIHGGAWREGDKSWCSIILPLLEDGYAIASVDYRLSQEARFPAQIRDVKAAARWLRVHVDQWGLDAQRFASAGDSAGGHLAALLGMSFYYKFWDRQGEYTECVPEEISSAVQVVVDWYGPSDLLRMNDRTGKLDHLALNLPESQLIGGTVTEHPDRAAYASPVNYVYPAFPSFLILHGDHDPIVPHTQSLLLAEALQKRWCHTELVLLEGAGHGFEGAQYRQALDLTRDFLQRELCEVDFPHSVFYACTTETFCPRTRHAVRWLNPFKDYPLARTYWNMKPDNDLSEQNWQEAHKLGYSYAAVVEADRIVSSAAVLRSSEVAWELAAVSTLVPEKCGQGYATSTCSFVTQYILGAGHIATVSTTVDNLAMQRVAERIGYQRV